ncbi:uncharacterized protein BYT42DRAFT_610765 [Radiomyces spectabilis]|uniref:uncharacterized protein n=1 Tax=Radiomyces spectabilis TaxID=64574 RepID=UPI002221078E|nr:uncharacterized protein BYT42DRAFT_610765 [Radiomyces spectabilis]KAI8391549.1 hypothetical protein BYT42DRAFT_610765 [Radiomyces spectabilis]
MVGQLNQLLNLSDHFFERGLKAGIGSDITVSVPAWDKEYKFHTLVLDQIPYFRVLFEGKFCENTAEKITLQLEDNPYITPEAFQLTLKYVYSQKHGTFTDKNVLEVLALSSYFWLDSLSDLCVDYITDNMAPDNVLGFVKFVDEKSSLWYIHYLSYYPS